MTAFILLAKNSHPIWEKFLKDASDQMKDVDFYILVDSIPETTETVITPNFKLISISRDIENNGYCWACAPTMNLKCVAWDKAVYYVSEVKTHYEFVWYCEDDVLIPSIYNIQNLINKYKANSCDLVCREHKSRKNSSDWNHWVGVNEKFYNEDYSNEMFHHTSMVCAMGISRRLIEHMKTYIRKQGLVPFVEHGWNTIAAGNWLNVVIAPEFACLYWRHINDPPSIYEILVAYNNEVWYHPVKDIPLHEQIRSGKYAMQN